MKYLLIPLILITGIVLGAFGYKTYIDNKPRESNQTTNTANVQNPNPTEIPVSPAPAATTTTNGKVEGALGYPSEGIPASMIVCAETLTLQKVKCTDAHIEDKTKFKSGVGYALEIPAGDYYIYAQMPASNTNYKAYYSDFVPCGLSVNCPSHKPIKVVVSAGQTTSNIDPVDWYAPQQ